MAMTSITNPMLLATKQLAIYENSAILIAGLIGNVCTILILNHLKLFRRNQCAFYLIVGSIADFALITIAVPFRITASAFNYDPMQFSLVWCKIRQTLVPLFILMSYSSMCFAAIDQYLSTNYRPWLRQLSTLTLAHRLIYSAIVIWTVYVIPFLIFFDIQSTSGCGIYNVGFLRYYSFVQLCILGGILPITVAGLSALLAFLNVRRIIRRQVPLVRRRLDRQITAMVLSKVMFFIVTTSPFVIYRIYNLNVSVDHNNPVSVAVDNLIYTITWFLFYANAAGTFYVFLLVSKRFRQQVKHLLVKNIWTKLLLIARSSHAPQQNQVAPTSESVDVELE